MGWFGPSKDEVWRQLSEESGPSSSRAGSGRGARSRPTSAPGRSRSTPTPIDTGDAHVTYTRMRAPYVNPEGFRFTIYRKGLFSELGKLLGMQDIEVGDPEFDEAFIIKGNDEARVRELFADPKLRPLILAQPRSGWRSRTARAGSVPSSPRTWTSCTSRSSG